MAWVDEPFDWCALPNSVNGPDASNNGDTHCCRRRAGWRIACVPFPYTSISLPLPHEGWTRRLRHGQAELRDNRDMSMRRLWALAATGMLLAGCNVEVSTKHADTARAAERLACPDREGGLRRVSAAADGRRCVYEGPDGAEVELRLADAGQIQALDAELRTLVPAAGGPQPPEPPAPPAPPTPPEGAGTTVTRSSWSVRVDDGEITWERSGGAPLPEADASEAIDAADRAHDAAMQAHDEAMEAHDAALEADDAAAAAAPAFEAGAASSSLLLTAPRPGAGGWRVAGYQARGGTAADRRVVGVLKARTTRGAALMRDVGALVDRNVS